MVHYAILLFCIFIADAASADDQPMLQLDTGGHMSTIRRVTFTPDSKQIVSAGEDKVIRVWDLESGKTVRAMRGESGPGQAGHIYALALSPDGKWLAVGGDFQMPATPTSYNDDKTQVIRLYNFKKGKLIALLKGHTGPIRSLAFSPDGHMLLSGSSDNTAIIWKIGLQSDDRDPQPRLLHRLEGHRAEIFSVAFSPDGKRAVTSSYDTELRLWKISDGTPIRVMSGHKEKVYRLTVAPNGTIASGDVSGTILLWDREGRFLRTLAQNKTGVGSLTFSRDGKLLVSTCGFLSCSGAMAYVYDIASGRVVVSYTGHNNAVYASAASPDGHWIATGGGTNNAINVWKPSTGQEKLGPDGQPMRLKGIGQTVWSAGFSSDGRRIGWGYTDACPEEPQCPDQQNILQQALTLPLDNSRLRAPEGLNAVDAKAFRHESAVSGLWSLSHREGAGHGTYFTILDVSKEGHLVTSINRDSSNGRAHHSYSFTPDGETIVSGGSYGVITAYDREGKMTGEFVGHEGNVYSVVSSPNGRYLVSSSADQTTRLWNLQTRELIVSLFQGIDGEWVMWTPQGYYHGSPGADRIVGWQINKGPSGAADYVTAEQLRKQLHRPDIVEKAIRLASAAEAVRTSRSTKFDLSDLLTHPAPHLRILSPAQGSVLNSADFLTVRISLDAPPDPVKRIRVVVNDSLVEDRIINYSSDFEPGEHDFQVPVSKGDNKIVLTAYNDTGWSRIQDGTLRVTNRISAALNEPGALYIVAVGVNKYPKAQPLFEDLHFAGPDALSFVDEMKKRIGPLHLKIAPPIVLINDYDGSADHEPNRRNIIRALDQLRNAKINDTVVVFISGHGDNDGPYYRFLPTDAEYESGRILPDTVINWSDIQRAIEVSKGRKLIFVDTCHSGNAYNELLGSQAYYGNMWAFSSSGPEQLSWEGAGHGLFTQAILEGMEGKASNGSGSTDTETLYAYLKKRVPELAKALPTPRKQDPQLFKGLDATSYLLDQF